MLYKELLKFNRDLQRHQIAIIPTYTCNLECEYCWQDRQKLPTRIMDAQTVTLAFKAVDQLVEGIDPDQVDICLFGGEPLQADQQIFDTVKCIIEQSRQRNFKLKAITNGVNLREYLPLFGDTLDVVQVTLDGPAEIHENRRPGKSGDFWKIIESIDHAINRGVSVNIRVNVAPENLNSISELSKFVEDRWGLHGPQLYLSPVKENNLSNQCNGTTSIKEILHMSGSIQMPNNINLMGYRAMRGVEQILQYAHAPLQRFFSCEAQLNFWAFDPVGDIYVCYDACGNSQLSVGRFLPDLKIDESSLKKWRSHSSLNNEQCISCAAAPLCSGGCVYIEASQEKHSCDGLMDSYPIALSYFAKDIYDIATRGSSETVGFICS